MGCNSSTPIHPVLNSIRSTEGIKSSSQKFQGNESQTIVNEQSPSIKSKVIEAIKKKDIILAQKIVSQQNIKPNENLNFSDSIWTLIHETAKQNFVEFMKYILEDLVNLNSGENFSKIINIQDKFGHTPVMICCMNNCLETLEVLLKYDADLTIKDMQNKNAYNLAIECGFQGIDLIDNATKTKSSIASDNSSINLKIPKPSKFIKSLDKSDSKNLDINIIETTVSGCSLDMRISQETLTSSKLTLKENFLFKSDPSKRVHLLLNQLNKYNSVFIDDEFNKEASIMNNDKSSKEILWLKPSQLFKIDYSEIQMFKEFQGCTVSKSFEGVSLLALISTLLAEYPSRLIRVFNTRDTNQYGIYSINLYECCLIQEIIVDDTFPCQNNNENLIIKPDNQELWPLVLEKAMAKLYGSYNNIHNLGVDEILETICGMPTYLFNLKEYETEELWSQIYAYDKLNYIISMGKFSESDKKTNQRILSQIFSIVTLYEFNVYKIIKIKIINNNFSWKGDFSEDSKLWTNEIKEKVGFLKNEKNIIYMKSEDLTKNFDSLIICHYYENWHRKILKITSERNHANYYELTIDKETLILLNVFQKSISMATNKNNEYIPIEIKIAKKNPECINIIGNI